MDTEDEDNDDDSEEDGVSIETIEMNLPSSQMKEFIDKLNKCNSKNEAMQLIREFKNKNKESEHKADKDCTHCDKKEQCDRFNDFVKGFKS